MGPYWEDSTEGGGRSGRLGKVLSPGDTCSVVVWGGELGVVGANGSDTRGSSCGVTETGNEVEGKNSEGRFVAEGGDRKSASGSEETIAIDFFG